MKGTLLVCSLLGLLGFSRAQIVQTGQCDANIQLQTNFNLNQFLGTWYEIARSPISTVTTECSYFELTSANNALSFYSAALNNNFLEERSGVAVQGNGARLTVTIDGVSSEFSILSTDYTNYALVYRCENLGTTQRSVYIWQLGRTTATPSAQIQTTISTTLQTSLSINSNELRPVQHTDNACLSLPAIGLNEPVIIPGQCGAGITVVQNFDVPRFLGLWHETASYYSENALGTCARARYSLSGTTVDVLNSQVINQTLFTIDGTATVASTDGSGVLNVVLNVLPGVTAQQQLYVVATDYENFAISYACENVGNNTKRVHSWILARSPTLTPAIQQQVDQVVNLNVDLNYAYYQDTPRSADDCFYFPEITLNEPVIFEGTCEANFQVVDDFSPARFAGRWIDVESYYDEYTGSCSEATFTDGGSNFVINIGQVVNQQLVNQERIATIANDGSGRFTVTNGNLVYNILTTDYSGYALVYSCENLEDSRRRVRAHKLSRARQLETWQQFQINSAMSTINVLDDRYFNARDQSDSGCFYYPPVTGQPVIYRGQCDPNVQAMQNFDVGRYVGLWYDIEHYPQSFQLGTCATATYTPGDGGVVNVYNTEVVNQQLSTINGTAVVASTDGSAKLTVTFPVFGTDLTVDTPYWVLATDYEDYSIVYSCNNIDEESYGVTTWKLSRTQTLSQNAITEFNNVMNRVPVIRQQYFQQTSHSAADCFYYPDNFGGPVVLDGQCPTANQVNVVTNFQVGLFSGTWHEAARFPSELQAGECGSTTMTISSATTFTITQANIVNERLSQANGTGTVSNDGRGIITAVLTNPSTGAFTTLPLYVLTTDYTGYALVYSCRNLDANRKQSYSWKLSRTRAGLSQIANDAINVQVSINDDLFEGYYEPVSQTDDACFYYPVYDPLPEDIQLPGPCPTSIRGVSDFDVAGYLGRWYEIESYPQFYQNGVCARAEYSLGSAGVDVYNTQVVDQKLDVMIGSAVVASDDGSGQLDVTFVVGGVTNVANYYILAVDYTDYALVYSCRNMDNGNRQVTSWKLSRTRSLSAQAVTAMNNVIQNTQGLLQDYYTPTSQTDEACFYIPDEPAEFRGPCDPNVPRMQNFDIARYLGWWHEIERYPLNNSAECTSSQFGSGGSGYQVVDIGVSGGVGTYSTVPVVASADGRLRRTYPDGSNVDTWVLDTDYETYSLLYSCENIIKNDEEYRRVWSAKHSKTRALTNAAQSSMAAIIAQIPVLVEDFYQTVSQSDQACFHYPEQTNQQIILPGQCDENIPVVTDFQIPDYSGTWYQIERYPQIHETGDCTGARYTLDESAGVVNVLNWEVVNGTLETIEGTAVPTYDDGTARLTVTLPVRGSDVPETVTTPLYVLTTDYVSYSLAYSCVNVNQFQRAIGVWKISRERTMPAAGTAAINSYMATRQELHQPYFRQVAHNEDCEEPSGGYIVKSSVIVVLICALLQLLY